MACTLDKFDNFFNAELQPLIMFLVRAGYELEESRDAAAEAMFCAYQGWIEIQYPKAYVRTVAQRVAGRQNQRDKERVLRSVRGGFVTLEQADPFPEIDATLDSTKRLLALLDVLPDKQRLVPAWHLDGFSNTEIAESLEMQVTTVASNLRHAKNRIRELLNTEERIRATAVSEGGAHHDAP
ncbi:sigma-70 family RNA polymerase sigma factor [Saccharothrix deserti]|uniref:sigma-70 family RNA polymerase sigma factor n=1 Tax=Saccharothrix deserti TaxID=2593674 RepID=UPI00131BDE3F|nr:sigma factor-like helix-turn-helix DNA-binding protein [Saccharothrix deserti]